MTIYVHGETEHNQRRRPEYNTRSIGKYGYTDTYNLENMVDIENINHTISKYKYKICFINTVARNIIINLSIFYILKWNLHLLLRNVGSTEDVEDILNKEFLLYLFGFIYFIMKSANYYINFMKAYKQCKEKNSSIFNIDSV